VRGPVHAGDYVVPSGQGDGVGVAVSGGLMTAAQAGQVVGRAIEASDDAAVKPVMLAVGLPHDQLLGLMLEARDQEIASLKAAMASLSSEMATLKAAVTGLASR
jgi:hypothetical protein